MSSVRHLFCLAIVAILPLPGQTVPTITGRVRVTTSLTKKRISVPQVYERHAALAPPAAPANAAADMKEELRRVVIFIDTAGLRTQPVLARIDQRQRRFEPEIVVVPAGSSVDFPNSDPIFHNVFSLSGVKRFDLGNYSAGQSRSVTFPKPGLVQVHCHLHPNMSGAILVTPNGVFTQPDEAGEFSLAAIPSGRYQVVAWHKNAGFFRRSIEVRSTAPVTVDFEIPLVDSAACR
jgi:plastocyanin